MKLLKYLIIYRTTKNPMMAAKIYQMIYHPEITHTNQTASKNCELEYYEDDYKDVVLKPSNKKQELLSSLAYLKNKKVKTKQDRDSIYTIEMFLKSIP